MSLLFPKYVFLMVPYYLPSMFLLCFLLFLYHSYYLGFISLLFLDYVHISSLLFPSRQLYKYVPIIT